MINQRSFSQGNEKVAEVYNLLRPYQKEVFEQQVENHRWLNYMDMGMGKSLVTACSVMFLKAFPCIIVCPKSAMYVWEEELRKWFDEEAIIYVGKPKQRIELFKQFSIRGIKFIITNYALVQELATRFGIETGSRDKGSITRGTGDAKHTTTLVRGAKWHVGGLISDEIQLGGLFNHKTKTYRIFQLLTREIDNVFLLTGTPYRKGCIDFFGPLSLVAPKDFASYWSYVGRYCVTINSGFGKSIERNPKDVVQFRSLLRNYASIMKKEQYLHELPGKQRIPIPIVMDSEQARVYKELTEELYALTDNGELIMTPGVLALISRQRQLVAAPQVLGLNTRGEAINTMLEMSEDLVEGGKPFVIFTPFRQAVSWIAQALREKYPATTIFQITGGLTPQEFARQWQGFQNGNRSRILIAVIKSAASFHATCADTCFFIGYEWDFNQNEQAEDRLNRMGQKQMVTCYYLMHKDTIDDDVIQRLNDKKYTSELILTDESKFLKMLAKRE